MYSTCSGACAKKSFSHRVERFREKLSPLQAILVEMTTFPSFAGFWYPANNICISLVLVLSLVQMLKHKRKVAGRAYTVLNLDKQLFVI